MASKPDFEAVAAAALDMAHVLLPEWLGGRKQGNEWVGESRANGGVGNSWCVNLSTGAFGHFSGDERGGDLISLYAALHHIKQGAALKEVAARVGLGAAERPPLVLDHAHKPKERPAEPIPLSAPNPKPHYEHGEPVSIHRYGDSFWICRYEFGDGEKLFRPFTWRAGGWQATGYPDPRPLYRLKEITEDTEAQVLIVEGEKCADAAAQHLGMCITTWANGAAAIHKNDWSPLNGRDVIIWPDADEAGAGAAAKIAEILQGHAKRVRILKVEGKPQGWDVADAIAEGWDRERLVAFIKENLGKEVALAEPAAHTEEPVIEAGEQGESALVTWQSLGLDCGEGGSPHATVANGSAIIFSHPELAGKIWYDTFTDKIYTNLKGSTRQWTSTDVLDMTVFIQHSMRLNKFTERIVASAAMHAARRAARNSLTDYLDALVWDGQPRLKTWLMDTLGCEHNDYTMAVAVNWPISMIARAYQPGCKVDTMPVLEGVQGLSKSTFLEVLGAPWYGSIPVAFGEKDFLQAIQGRWLVEIPDMTGFSKREHTQILATITIRSDIYRPSYGQYTEEHPRVTVFAATSETDNYLQDQRGRRRYWPIRCTDISLDALRAQKDQVFAEARERYREGATWYKMPASADEEQRNRAEPDLWTDQVLGYAESMADQKLMITTNRILHDVLELPLAKQGQPEKNRVARIMKEGGWVGLNNRGRYWKKMER